MISSLFASLVHCTYLFITVPTGWYSTKIVCDTLDYAALHIFLNLLWNGSYNTITMLTNDRDHDNSKVKISCDLFSGPEKGRLWCLMASSGKVSGRAPSGRLNTPRWQQVPDSQSPIACFVRRGEALFFLHDVWHPRDFGPLLVEFHLERWDDLVEFSVLFQKS